MAKVSFAALLASALIAATYAIPVPQAIDWEAVKAKVEAVQVQTINHNLEKLIAVAMKDNPNPCIEIGGFQYCLSYIVNRHNHQWIRASTRVMEWQVFDQTLTPTLASYSLDNIHRELGLLLNDLQPWLDLLSESVVNKVNVYFDKMHRALNEDASDLWRLLLSP